MEAAMGGRRQGVASDPSACAEALAPQPTSLPAENEPLSGRDRFP